MALFTLKHKPANFGFGWGFGALEVDPQVGVSPGARSDCPGSGWSPQWELPHAACLQDTCIQVTLLGATSGLEL